jgi:hypothetical protein
MADELGAKAALLLHETGQVLEFAGEMEERQYPSIAALISAMIATGKSLGQMGDHFTTSPTRFACDSETMGLYTCAVTEDTWLAALYDQPLNPALHRMKIRRYAQACAHLQARSGAIETGAESTPIANMAQGEQAKTTIPDPSLFTNITDDEIDRLFDEASS